METNHQSCCIHTPGTPDALPVELFVAGITGEAALGVSLTEGFGANMHRTSILVSNLDDVARLHKTIGDFLAQHAGAAARSAERDPAAV